MLRGIRDVLFIQDLLCVVAKWKTLLSICSENLSFRSGEQFNNVWYLTWLFLETLQASLVSGMDRCNSGSCTSSMMLNASCWKSFSVPRIVCLHRSLLRPWKEFRSSQTQDWAKRKGKQTTEEKRERVMGKSQDPDSSFRGMVSQEVAQKKSHDQLISD